ncbi:MAG: tetratricopeptide repeat protein [Sideroxydans sp.]|nr:tetratricopeptide repeat protein [Sideroxydans sp.]
MFKSIYALLIGGLVCGVAIADDLSDANQLFKQGQAAAALSKVDNHLAAKPKDAQGRFLKGLILTEQGKPNDAIKIFSSLTSDYPELPEPYNNLAVLYAGQGQYDKAKQSLEMAIRTHPSYATAHENLGDIYAKMASQAYDRALQLDKSNAGTQTKLAMIQDIFSGTPRPKANISQNVASGTITPKPVATPVAAVAPPPVALAKPAVAAAPVAAAKPLAVSTAVSDEDDIKAAVHAWAAAWSAQNAKKYLAAYAEDFRPADGASRSDWAQTRRERLAAPKSIKVSLSELSIKVSDSNHASAHFRQAYHANTLQTSSHKTLLLVKADGRWLIQEERTK